MVSQPLRQHLDVEHLVVGLAPDGHTGQAHQRVLCAFSAEQRAMVRLACSSEITLSTCSHSTMRRQSNGPCIGLAGMVGNGMGRIHACTGLKRAATWLPVGHWRWMVSSVVGSRLRLGRLGVRCQHHGVALAGGFEGPQGVFAKGLGHVLYAALKAGLVAKQVDGDSRRRSGPGGNRRRTRVHPAPARWPRGRTGTCNASTTPCQCGLRICSGVAHHHLQARVVRRWFEPARHAASTFGLSSMAVVLILRGCW